MIKRKRYYGILFMLLSIVGLLLIGCGKEEGYRMMQVYQVAGTATINRENIGSMDAYENLNLISGDKVSVSQDSYMRLKVDEDKYVLAEAGTVFTIYATGSDKSGKTDIQLEKGAITVEVENKLSEDSSFEVTTPNSVMAVRGTVFRISTDVDADNKDITVVTILDGTVTVQKRYEDGTLSEEQPVTHGEEAVIYEESSELVLVISDEIDIRTLPIETLDFLRTIIEDGTNLSVTIEELDEVIEEKKAEMEENDSQDTDDADESSEITTDDGEDSDDEGTEDEEGDSSTSDTTTGIINNTFPTDTNTESSTEPDTEPSTEPDTEPTTETYTVTFQYQGNVFGTQEVEAGKTATKPKLMPAASGNWDFDFSTPIESDTVIEFK